MPSYRALSRNHDFTVLWTAQTISEVGSRVSLFVFPVLTYAMTSSATLAAVVEATYLLGLVLALLPAGILADRADRRRIMRTASGTGVVLYASLALALVADAFTIPHLLVVALFTGAGAGLFGPAETAAVRTVVPPEDLPTALSQTQARLHLATLLSAPLGGLLYAAARWLPFAADAASFAFSWVLLGRLRTDLSAPPSGDGPRRPTHDLTEGLRFLRSRPLFRVLLIWGPLTNLTINALFFAAILRLIDGGFDAVHIGLVEATAGAAGIIGAIFAPWIVERIPTGWLTVGVAWVFLPLVVPMALWNHPAVVAAALGVGMLLNPAGNTGMSSYRLTVTPPELVGRVQAAMQFVGFAALPLSPLLAGALFSTIGGPATIAVLGSCCGCVALIPTLSRSVRSVPRPADWPTADEPVAVAPVSASC
jgi:predicted MFS family arabinose efflux permease